MRLSGSPWLFASLFALGLSAGCGDKDDTSTDDSAVEADADADADADSDTDADSDSDADSDVDTGPFDADGDGFNAAEDCDDDNASINPDAFENCDTPLDDNCDNEPNEIGALNCTTWNQDADGDSYGSRLTQCSCDPIDDYNATNGDDCDDADSAVNPGATEDTSNGVDDNCDGEVDEGGSSGLTSYATDIAPLFATCGNCHPSSGGFSFSGYSSIVGVASSVSGMNYIEPNDAANSYIWHKLNNTQGTVGGRGGQMPQNGALTGAELRIVETWINDGCPQ